MNPVLRSTGGNPFSLLLAVAVSIFIAACANPATAPASASPRIEISQLQQIGFKTLVATTPVQQEWVRKLPVDQIRPMQRNGKDLFIYPDATNNQIYIGGAQEYDAYLQLHPEYKDKTQQKTKEAAEYRVKQTEVMQKATTRDLSDPFLGVSWYDLGW